MAESDPQRTRTIAVWEQRAHAYARFTEEQPVFERCARRLLELVPEELEGTCLDLGAGAGLLSTCWLEASPSAQLHLVEPAERMLSLARERLGSRAAGYHALPAERAHEAAASGRALAAASSASAHLFDDASVLESLARALVPGAPWAFHLWSHSFEETAQDGEPDWRGALEHAAQELELPAPSLAPARPMHARGRDELAELAQAHGFELEALLIDTDALAMDFTLAFSCMDEGFLDEYAAPQRKALLARARGLLVDAAPAHLERSTRVLMRRRH